jgi:uncharacterized membrane-anchored protein YhcB (DUF1043 family)
MNIFNQHTNGIDAEQSKLRFQLLSRDKEHAERLVDTIQSKARHLGTVTNQSYDDHYKHLMNRANELLAEGSPIQAVIRYVEQVQR